jgi:hypothetical protein
VSDAVRFLADLSARGEGNRLRIGVAKVRSVDTDPVYTLADGQTVIVPASQEWGNDGEVVANYLGEYPPRPGGMAWYVTDGVDRIVLGMVAPEGPPMVHGFAAGTTAITSGSATIVTLQRGNDPWFATTHGTSTTGTGVFQCPVDGLYSVSAYAGWASNATGLRQTTIMKNGTAAIINQIQAVNGASTYQAATVPQLECSKGDILAMRVRQDSGANLNLIEAEMRAVYVGRRRAPGFGPEQLADGSFEFAPLATFPANTWSFAWATSATWTQDVAPNVYAGQFAIKGVHNAGTVLTAVQSKELVQVAPGQSWRVTAAVKTSSALSGTGDNFVTCWLALQTDGEPDLFSSDTTLLTSSNRSTGTAYAVETFNFVIPANMFVAKLMLRCRNTAGVTIWWDDVTFREVIS